LRPDLTARAGKAEWQVTSAHERNLNAVALKAVVYTIGVRETDARRPASGILAKNMRRLRAERGLTQEALATIAE
jgi:hypothetical protein